MTSDRPTSRRLAARLMTGVVHVICVPTAVTPASSRSGDGA